MALKKFNPTTPGQRNLVLVDKSDLYKGKPVKKLTEGLSKSGGRNNSGHVTSWHRGGGHKRRYRMVDFKRTKTGMMDTVERLEYDPNRTAFIALITYEDGEQSYIRLLSVWLSVTRCRPVSGPTSSLATRCRCRTSRSVRSCIMSS